MFKWLGQRFENRKQKTRQLWENEFNIVDQGLDEEQVVAFVDNLIAQHKASQQAPSAPFRSLLKTAVTDAEQIATSIKMKAQTEAEVEAERIISQAKQEAQEIKKRTEIATQKEAEAILSVTNKKIELTQVEAKQKALLFLLRAKEEIEEEISEEYKRVYSRLFSSLQDLMSEGHNIEMELKGKRAALWESKSFELQEHVAALLSTSEATAAPPETPTPIETQIEADIASKEKTEEPIQLQEEATEEVIEQPIQLQEEPPKEKIEQPTQLQEEVTVSAPVEAAMEEHLPKERLVREETESALLKQDSHALYADEVELAIAVPVELVTVSKLYNHLQTIPELRILRTTGSWNRGTTITVVLDKPIPLLSIISKIPGVEVTAELLDEDSLEKVTSSSPLGAKRKGVKRIKLTLKET